MNNTPLSTLPALQANLERRSDAATIGQEITELAAHKKVRVAKALAELPEISGAFSEGRISYSKVRAMTRVATPKNEEYLLGIARHGTAAHVEKVVSNYRRCKRLASLEADNNRHSHRELCWQVDSDGMWVLKGKFTAEQGALIEKALMAATATWSISTRKSRL